MSWKTTNVWFASGFFQLVWSILVIFRADAQWWIFLLWLASEIFLFISSHRQCVYSLKIFSIGLIVDSMNHEFGMYDFGENMQFIPFWLVVLWGCFSVYATQVMQYLSSLPRLLLLGVGGVGGCLSYNSAYYLGAVNFPLTTSVTSIIIFAEWVGVTYAMVKLYCK